MAIRVPSATSILCVIFVAACGGCSAGGGGAGIGRVIQFGTTKADLFGVPAEYRALHMGLEKCFGEAVAFRAQPNGMAVGQQLEYGNIPYAILSATEYAAVENPSKLTLVASAVNSLGKTSRRAHIVVKAKSHLKTISDCAGKRFAFGTHGDLLTDIAAQKALEASGVPIKKLLPELLPPPFALEGRLYVQDDVASKIVLDLTVNAGVIDELVFEKMPATGGNPITGPSRDEFEIVGETIEVPEMVVVAGPASDVDTTQKLKDYLLTAAKDDGALCKQLGIKGFAPADPQAYDAVRQLFSRG